MYKNIIIDELKRHKHRPISKRIHCCLFFKLNVKHPNIKIDKSVSSTPGKNNPKKYRKCKRKTAVTARYKETSCFLSAPKTTNILIIKSKTRH